MPLGKLAHLPHTLSVRGDEKAIVKLLEAAGVDPTSPVGRALHGILAQRTRDCRDFFTLRGGSTRRATRMLMAGRAVAADEQEARNMDRFTPGQGAALLRAMAQLMELRLGPPAWRVEVAPASKPALRPAASQDPAASARVMETDVTPFQSHPLSHPETELAVANDLAQRQAA
jgi:hypothetical protein